jgi:hypothetical protein
MPGNPNDNTAIDQALLTVYSISFTVINRQVFSLFIPTSRGGSLILKLIYTLKQSEKLNIAVGQKKDEE